MILSLLASLACSNPPAVADAPIAQPVKAATSAPAPSALSLTGPRPKNVLMLSIDTLRRDHVSRYGKRASTPFLDRFLSEGVALDHHRSCSNWTLASVVCALSGKDHLALEYLPEVTLGTPDPAPARVDFLDEILAGHGFYTARYTPNLFLDAQYGVGNPKDLVFEKGASGETVSTEGLAMLDRAVSSGKPWFVQLHFLDPHAPYETHPVRHYGAGTDDAYARNPRRIPNNVWVGWSDAQKQMIEDKARALYRGDVEYTDQVLDGLWKTLQQRGLLDDTLVVVWSDHGEQFWERGSPSHGNNVNAEESDAIAGFWAKSLARRPITVPTSHDDIVPTILSVLGFDGDIAKEKMTGLVAGTGSPDRAIFTEDFSGQNTKMSVDKDNRRLIYNWEGRLQLFDLATDPGETHDKLAAMARTNPDDPAFPEDGRALWKLLEPRVTKLDALYQGISPVLPGRDPTAEQLSAPRNVRERGPDEMAQGGGASGGRGKAGGKGTKRRSN
jgi:arylsulfatase A-like enzyme